MRPPIDAVLFDFHGTLMYVEEAATWVRISAERAGVRLDDEAIADLAVALMAAGRAGGPIPANIPAELADAFAQRDLTAQLHRTAYTGLMATVGRLSPEFLDALYARGTEPAAWLPYADARPTLDELKGLGVRVGLLSNIGFGLRDILAAGGLLEALDDLVLSYQVELQKPDPAIFRLACERLGVKPERTLMVGDTPADGGAVRAGLRTYLLPASPTGAAHGLDAIPALVRASRG